MMRLCPPAWTEPPAYSTAATSLWI